MFHSCTLTFCVFISFYHANEFSILYSMKRFMRRDGKVFRDISPKRMFSLLSVSCTVGICSNISNIFLSLSVPPKGLPAASEALSIVLGPLSSSVHQALPASTQTHQIFSEAFHGASDVTPTASETLSGSVTPPPATSEHL